MGSLEGGMKAWSGKQKPWTSLGSSLPKPWCLTILKSSSFDTESRSRDTCTKCSNRCLGSSTKGSAAHAILLSLLQNSPSFFSRSKK